MAPLSHNDRYISNSTEPSAPALRKSPGMSSQTHPEALCGEWKYEYRLPYSPYGNQCLEERYSLLSCGIAYKAVIDKYDEGDDYFSERKTSGWGRWFVEANGELSITCTTRTSAVVGGTVCGKGHYRDHMRDEYYSDSELRESESHFVKKFTRQKSLDDMDEEKLCAQMLHFLRNLPPKTEQAPTEDEEEQEEMNEMPYKNAHAVSRQSQASSQPSQKLGTLSSLRRIFSRNKRLRV